MTHFDAAHPLSPDFLDAIGAQLTAFVDEKAAELEAISQELTIVAHRARLLSSGGKRLRPAFCYWGFVAAAGQPSEAEPLLRAAAAFDLLHNSALAHDDVIDDSDTRRGQPAAHRAFEKAHRAANARGDAAAFGRAGAILLGNLLGMWSVELFDVSGLTVSERDAAGRYLHAVRTEVNAGQYLDMWAEQSPAPGAEALAHANRVVEFKSAKYSVQRPAQAGAAIGGADDRLLNALEAYGSPLGRAFQFRDDLLGVFGDESVTGKPAGDDLREGKRTVLVAHALAKAPAQDATELDSLLGNRELTQGDIERARQIIEASGAREAVERDIATAFDCALSALEETEMTGEGKQALTALADAAVRRDR